MDAAASRAGFTVSRRPAVGAIAQWRDREPSPPSPRSEEPVAYPPYRDALDLVAGPYGHVAVVMRVLRDGSVLVTQYDGHSRLLQRLHVRAPRYLYLGVGSAG